MEAAAHGHHDHDPMPTSGSALTSVAFSATLHCLTGCAIGEVTGMVVGTALGFSDLGTIVLAVGLAFLFGYTLTSVPLLRAGLALSAVIPIALASDTLSIAVMEVVDNAIMLAVPGAMEAGIDSLLFWGSLSVALVIAGAFALPVNRWLIARGKGHVAVHETGIHGGPPTRVVAAVAALAAVFGTVVLTAEAIDDDGGHMAGHEQATGAQGVTKADHVRGLAVSDEGLTLALGKTELPRDHEEELTFGVLGAGGEPVREFETEHEKRMHLIIVRRDLTGFQHLHPELGADGSWRTSLRIPDAGSYRVFADFKHEGEARTLAADLSVDGTVDWKDLPAGSDTAHTADGYEVRMDGGDSAGREAELAFTVLRGGEPVAVEQYLGAGGHLVALREGDLAYLHVHPAGHEAGTEPVAFMTEFPSEGRYRLFLQFKHEGRVHTVAFTREVSGSGASESGERKEGGHHGG
jgi:Domain of unknown function (DUF4396)